MIKINSLETNTGKIIEGDDSCSNIFQLSLTEIRELFKSCGLIFFRGFAVDRQQFQKFAEQFSSKFVRDDVKIRADTSDGAIHLINEGMGYIAPHAEGATTPLRPDAVWFCCDVPAADGGETLFWDGVQVWSELSEELQQLFVNKKNKFIHNIPVANWKHFLGENATIVDVEKALNNFEGIQYTINDDQSVTLAYVCSAVVKTKYGNDDSFANGIINEHRTRKVIFEDDSPIPDAAIDEIKEVMDRLTIGISWQSGDLVMIDNSRFLHGRQAFTDSRRKIFFANSMLNF
ncbi:TauD/TfdA family dioxygenase [Kamptonema sp. UHCC 0994]|uniref:TauD/TfdA family dioxygenase n=1 Tax=Kamptonema sp. UHCC 0994 TaxID=3031329 RepID=UPI0023B8869A|nr:TauD/TfdA family dioxygenase [Kamptonema sp. UHCC 0994]MDF0552717.1 TauD/TfdA family dioxygenase [Kamptonema sp. UHCC 0994]